jgi:eukaryotic-like serine/threonine-protein kinase
MDANRGFAPGMTLGTHRLERLLGRGGMGAVFLAYDTRLHRQVALKVIDSDQADATSSARLLGEARNAAALNHPHICTIYEVGEAGGTAFIAMEYVGGRSLRELVDEGALPVGEAVRLGIQAADALAYAHEHGVVHRDFKAANAIVGENSWLKVVDFGLARRDEARGAEATTLASVVPRGAVAGTPYSMAPEQVRGDAADARADIWALGVLLYEMVTGTRPFTGQTTPELFSSILTKAPAALPGQVPTGLRAVIERCLEKAPELRYQRAGDVRAALEENAPGTVAPWVTWGYHLRRRPGLAAASAVFVLGALLVGANVGSLRERLLGHTVEATPLRLAVLPLEDLSGDAEQAFFAAGMHDALITDLARIRALRVTARSSALRYTGTRKSVGEIARELNVDAVLTGSVARAGDRVRVTAQLMDAVTENHLWTDRYDRAVREVLSLQNEIVAAIAREVRLQLTPEEQMRLTRARPVDPEAHEAYLKGMFFLNQSTPDGVKRGMALLHEAVAKDPAHPLPYAHLAAGYATLGHGLSPPPDAFARARAAALKALELDDSVALAHTVLGELILYGERTWDWPAAERSFRRAIDVNPTLARAHAHYSWYLVLFDRWEEAFASMRRAREVDPLAPLWPAWEGWLYWAAGRPDDAIREIQISLELNPDFPAALNFLGFAYSAKGLYEEALAEHRRASALNPDLVWSQAYTHALAGQPDDARRIAGTLEQRGEDPYRVAIIHATLGSVDEAFRWLETAFEQRNSNIPWLRSTPGLRPLREDSRFADLLRRMKLPS